MENKHIFKVKLIQENTEFYGDQIDYHRTETELRFRIYFEGEEYIYSKTKIHEIDHLNPKEQEKLYYINKVYKKVGDQLVEVTDEALISLLMKSTDYYMNTPVAIKNRYTYEGDNTHHNLTNTNNETTITIYPKEEYTFQKDDEITIRKIKSEKIESEMFKSHINHYYHIILKNKHYILTVVDYGKNKEKLYSIKETDLNTIVNFPLYVGGQSRGTLYDTYIDIFKSLLHAYEKENTSDFKTYPLTKIIDDTIEVESKEQEELQKRFSHELKKLRKKYKELGLSEEEIISILNKHIKKLEKILKN